MHYNSNVNDTIEGPELYAFVGDIARYLGLKLCLSVIEAGVTRVKVSDLLRGLFFSTFYVKRHKSKNVI